MNTDLKAPPFLRLPLKDELDRIAVYFNKTPDTIYDHAQEVTKLFADREKPTTPEAELDR